MTRYYLILIYCILYFNKVDAQSFPRISITTDTTVILKGKKVAIKSNYDKSVAGEIVWKKNGIKIFSNIDSILVENLNNNDRIVCTKKISINKSEFSTLVSNILTFKVLEDYSKLKFVSTGFLGDSLKIDSRNTIEIQWYFNGTKIDNPLTNSSLHNGEKIIGTEPRINEIVSPGNITLDKSGYIYFADNNTNRVFKCDPLGKNCEVIAGANGEGANQNQFANPNKVMVDSLGYIYVLDSYNNRIQRWGAGSISGETLISQQNSIYGVNQSPNLLTSVRDFTLDAEGNIFVLTFDSILKFPKGSNTGKLYVGGNGFGQNLNQLYIPSKIQVDTVGNVFYLQSGANKSIRKWQNGAGLPEIVIGVGSSFNTYDPIDYVLDKNNDIIFSDVGGLYKYINKEGKIVQIGYRFNNLGDKISYQINFSRLTLFGNQVYFFSGSNPSNGYSLLKISNNSTPIVSLLNEFKNYGDNVEQITSPTSLELDNLGNVLITDKVNTLSKFDTPLFKHTKSFPLQNSISKSQFYDKNSIYYSGNNEFRRINLTEGKDDLIFKWNGSGNQLNQLNAPNEMHLLNDTVYISDRQNSRILRWKFLADKGEEVTKPLEILDPQILKIIDKQNLIIGNYSSIFKIDLTTNKTSIIYRNAFVSFNSNSRIDSLGNFYFVSSNNKIVKLNTKNSTSNIFATIDNFSPPTNGGNQSYNGKYFQIDKNGNLFVLDNVYKKVFKYYRNNNNSFLPKLPGEYSAIIKNDQGEFKVASLIIKVQDSDKDGVEDGKDKCPNTPIGQLVDSNGCSDIQKDSDKDGVSDIIDKCLNTPVGEKVDSEGCSSSQKDSDKDGVSDKLDKCPNTLSGFLVDINGCADNQKDSDLDGITDNLDKCPNTSKDEFADKNGCSLSQKDSDNDGVNDKIDICSNTILNSIVDKNGCAEYQKDTDKDGIFDNLDKCPGSTFGLIVDKNGCTPNQISCSNVKPNLISNVGGNLSTSTLGISYLWYINDRLIIENKIPNFTPTASGKYSIKVLLSDNCYSGISDYVLLVITEIQQENLIVKVSPNPFNNLIKIQFPMEFANDAKIVIMDIKGSIIYTRENVHNNEFITPSIKTTGIYFINIISNQNSKNRIIKLIKE